MGRRGESTGVRLRVCNNPKSNTLRLATFTRRRQKDLVLFGLVLVDPWSFEGWPLRGAAVCKHS